MIWSDQASVASSESSDDVFCVDQPSCSHGLRWRSCVAYRTRQMPLAPHSKKLKPRNHAIAPMSRHQRDLLERTRMMAIANPKKMWRAPSVRPKMIRGLLPLAIDQRMKFGWDWLRRVSVTVVMGMAKADGWVVCWRACSWYEWAKRKEVSQVLEKRGWGGG